MCEQEEHNYNKLIVKMVNSELYEMQGTGLVKI